MAVEAQHMHLFPSQLLTDRDFMKTNQGSANMYDTQMLPHIYQSVRWDPSVKAESGLTYNVSAPRKRSRDSINEFNTFSVPQRQKFSGVSSVFDQVLALEIQQQQLEIDLLMAEHSEKVELELEKQRKQQSRILVSAIHERVTKKLREKDEEIQRMGKLNWVLQERVKSLCIENQIWRDLAQTNEAAANSLRSNLEQVLAHVSQDNGGGAAAEEDAESSCGSSDYGRVMAADGGGVVGGGGGGRMCRRCGEREACVLLLPCRHLCVCTLCGSALPTCPVCNSVLDASLHVNTS